MISAESVTKRFRIGRVMDRSTFRGVLQTASGWFGRMVSRHDPHIDLWALKNVSFEVRRGESVGVVGNNGAGKSTLLKILSRITSPTSGRIRIWGRTASLLEVGTGFVPVLSGRENIFLNGVLLGMTRSEIRSRFDEIVAFAEVERFIDLPVQRYSSGMSVRLAFSIAAHLRPSLLIVDEVLAVGDQRFREKCLTLMRDYVRQGGTVLLVSHDSGQIRTFCQKAMWLRGGRLEQFGEVKSVTERYAEWSRDPAAYGGHRHQVLLSTVNEHHNLQGIELMLSPDPGYMVFRVDLIHNWFTEDALSVSGHTPIEEDRWHFAAVTYNGELSHRAIKLYLDGELETRFQEIAGRGISGRIDMGGPLQLGARAGKHCPLKGEVQLLLAENRQFSAKEIRQWTRRAVDRPEFSHADAQPMTGTDSAASPQAFPWSLELDQPFTIAVAFRLRRTAPRNPIADAREGASPGELPSKAAEPIVPRRSDSSSRSEADDICALRSSSTSPRVDEIATPITATVGRGS